MKKAFQNFIDCFRNALEGMKKIKYLNLSVLRKVFSLMGKLEKTMLAVLLVFSFGMLWLNLEKYYSNHTIVVPNKGGHYREGLVGQPRLINPVIASTQTDLALTKLVYSGLYSLDENAKIVPDLAESFPVISEDEKEYTVKIRENAKFHNGRPVVADDVVFTIQTIQNAGFKSPLRNDWLNTKVEKVSDLEVRFKNNSISAPFVYNLTLPILPEKIWSKVDAENFQLSELNLKPVGSGPYKVTEINKLPSGEIQKITLESFADYSQGQPYINLVSFVFYNSLEECAEGFVSGEVNGFAYVPFTQTLGDNLRPNSSFKYEIPLSLYQASFFNVKSKVLTEKDLRKILAESIPKTEIIEKVYKNEAKLLNSPILPEQLGFKDIEDNQIDSEKAASLLDNLGWKVDANGVRSKKNINLEINLATNDSPSNHKVAEILKESWERLNIRVNIISLNTKELNEKHIKPRSFDVLVFGQKTGADPDPFVFWHSSQAKDPGLNVSGFENTQTDALITEARSTTLSEIRNDRYERFLEIFNEERPAEILNQAVMVYYMNPEIKFNFSRINFENSQRFNLISKWYINEKRVFKN